MNDQEFINHLFTCMKSSPILVKNIRQALAATMGELAEKEDYEGACKYRDLVRFIDKRMMRKAQEQEDAENDSDCPCE